MMSSSSAVTNNSMSINIACTAPQVWPEHLPDTRVMWSGYQIWALMDVLRLAGKAQDAKFSFVRSGPYRGNDSTYSGVASPLQV